MSQAEELLNSLDISSTSEESHIVIGKDRFIVVPDKLKRIAVQYDHNIETVTFDCPRYWDEHDMSGMSIYINYLCADKEPGIYKAENVTVDTNDTTVMHFDWTITKNVTMASGQIAFLVCIKNTGTDGVEKNHWNSEICKDCYISDGMEYDDGYINEIYPDIIEQWHKEVLSVTDEIIAARDNGEFNGDPGVSPTIQISDINGGHRVTITDIDGTKSFDVMDTIIESSAAVKELLDRFVYVGNASGSNGATLWFDTDVSDSNEGSFDENTGCYLCYDTDNYSYALYPRTRKDLVFGMDEIDNFIDANKGIIANSDDGITYTATVDAITELCVGASFVMIPAVTSEATDPSLSINGFPSKQIVRRRVTATGEFFDAGYNINWLTERAPIRVTYDGSNWVADAPIIIGSELVGAVPIEKGGTDSSNIEQAAKNLKFSSLAYATELSGSINLEKPLAVGKYCIKNDAGNHSHLPFIDYEGWEWCILTVEDASGKGNTYPASPGYSYFMQTIENDCSEKFRRTIAFSDGKFSAAGDWMQYHTSKAPIILSDSSYGEILPSTGVKGQIFFKKNDGCYIFTVGSSWVKYF